jgi:hypothetical protein
LTVRALAARLAADARPSQPAPRIVTTRFAPHAGGMASLNHNSPLTKSRIFLRGELDSSGKTGGGFWRLLVLPRRRYLSRISAGSDEPAVSLAFRERAGRDDLVREAALAARPEMESRRTGALKSLVRPAALAFGPQMPADRTGTGDRHGMTPATGTAPPSRSTSLGGIRGAREARSKADDSAQNQGLQHVISSVSALLAGGHDTRIRINGS